jgi:hypothetical protein
VPPKSTQPARRGRPRNKKPRTELGRWLVAMDMTSDAFLVALRQAAVRFKIRREHVPSVWNINDAIRGKGTPSLPALILFEEVTAGAVDLQQWYRDLYVSRR